MVLFGLSKEQYMDKLKEDSVSRHKFYHPDKKDCRAIAPPWRDDWYDICGGELCCRAEGHTGEHMATDGANGWHYWRNDDSK